MDRARAGGALAVFGLLLLLGAVLLGGLPPDFRFGLPAFLARVGVVFLALGVATVALRPESVADAVVVSTLALVVVFVAGPADSYYELVTSPPTSGAPAAATRIFAFHAGRSVGLAPIAAGFVAGGLEARGRPSTAYRILIGATVVAWIVPGLLMAALGFSGLVQAAVMAHAIAALGIGLLPRRLTRQVTGAELKR